MFFYHLFSPFFFHPAIQKGNQATRRNRARLGAYRVCTTHYAPTREQFCHVPNAGFSLTCRLPHCRFDDDISSTAQASLAAEGWPSGKQRQANRSITLPLCPPWQIADSWILFNFTEKSKWVIWLIWAIVGHYTDKKTHFYIFLSHFVRVLTHYGSNESNDSFGFFCVGSDCRSVKSQSGVAAESCNSETASDDHAA